MTRRRLSTTFAVTMAAAAIGVPGAGARSADLRSPDARDLAGRVQVQANQDLRTPDAHDFAAHRRIVASTPVRITAVQYVSRTGFRTADAAIGAAGMLALILVGAGGAMSLMRWRRMRRRREAVDLLPAS
jgi:hypothetical protein